MKRHANISLRALLCASVFGGVLPTAAAAQDITIDDATTAQVSLGAGQTLTVTETGSITTAGRVIGVPTTGTGTATIVNRGRIESTSTTTLTSTIGPASTINLNLTNEAGGSITGARPVYFTTGELINRGTIASTMTGTSTADAINAVQDSIVRLEAGSVTSASSATTGNSYAVNFTGGGNSIYIDTGATVNGTIRAATGGVGANRVYLTGTGTQTLGPISGFNGYYIDSGDWTVTSSITAAAEGSTIAEGATLRWGNGGATGSISGNVVNNGRLIVNRTNQVVGFTTASITGTGQLIVDSPGAAGGLTLRAPGTSYSGDTIVKNGTFSGVATNAMSASSEVVLESAGILDIVTGFDQEIGGLSGAGATNINGAALTLGGKGTNTSYTGAFAGDGSLTKVGAGTLTYGGTGALGGGVTVRGGGLLLDGTLTSDLLVENGGQLGGTGSLAGNSVVNGTLAGLSGQTLTLQSLQLGAGSTVSATLGSESAPVLFDVLGDLTLDGALTVTPATDFGAGLYRIFSYGGTLTDNGLDVGALSGGATGALQTATAGQVNLVVSTGSTLSDIQFWNGTKVAGDGTIAGGDGVWSVDGRTNWTDLDGATTETWGGRFAVFTGPAGTVTIDDDAGAISTSGLQFVSDGYRIEGDPLTLAGAADVRVGDGTAAGATTSATIASNITGSGTLIKQDLGTLILAGANDHAGGTRIAGGTLRIDAGGSLATTGATPAVGIVASTPPSTVTLVNAGRITASDRAIDAATGTTLSLLNESGGVIEGASGVYLDAGEVINRGSITATTGDAIHAAAGSTVRLEAGSTTAFTGSGTNYAVNFLGGSNTLYLDTGATVTGQIRGASAAGSGPDRVYLNGTGSAVLPSMTNFEGYYFQSGDWTVTASFLATAEGSTIDEGATLRWGNGGTTGSISGQVTNNGRLIINRTNQVVGFTTAPITGTGQLIIDSPGAAGGLTLRAPGTTYSGDTIVRNGTFSGVATNAMSANSEVVLESAGILDIVAGFDQEIGGLSGVGATNINGAALTIGGKGTSTSYTGAFAGDGSLIKVGAGTLTYGGTGALGGGVTVRGGSLLLEGNLTSDLLVENGGRLGGTGTLAGNAVVDGTLAGLSGQTLTLQSLVLGTNATVAATLGSESAPVLFDVLGDLTLDGTLAVTPTTDFGAGLYRIFAYGGTLTDNGLDVGPLGSGTSGALQTATAGQVNLVVSTGSTVSDIQFWNGTKTAGDGTIAGGDGVWSAGPATNWTDLDGVSTEAWGGRFAVFAGAAGTVTIDDDAGAIAPAGMQFVSSGYRVEGDPLTLTGAVDVRVGDGTAAGAATSATIASNLTGAGSLVKRDLGTLTLTGTNNHAGGTRIADGTLRIDAGGSLDTAGTTPAVGIVASTPASTVTLVNAGRITASERAIDAAAGTTLSLLNESGGVIQGASGVYLAAGEVVNRGSITATNGDAIQAAAGSTVRLEAGSTTAFTGSGTNYAVNFLGGSNNLYIDTGATVTGQIRGASATGSGPDRVYLTGSGSAILPSMTNFEGYYFQSGDWTVTASFVATAEGSTIDAGATLRWGNGGTTGSVSGQVTNNGRLIINRTNQVVAFTTAPITGTGQLIVDSPGAVGGLTLRAPGTTYSGDTIVRNGTFRGGASNAMSANSEVVLESAGTLDIIAGFDQEIGGLSGVGATNINGAALTLGGTGLSTSYTGALSGDGSLVKTGTGTLTYGGTGALGGGITVRGGRLTVDGNLTSDVLVEAGASLGGAGLLAGNAVVDGTLAGLSGQTLTLQSLELGAGSTVAATLGSESAPTLFEVLGDLTLDGTLAVTPDTGFGAGLYRIFAYGGALTDNGLDVDPLGAGITGTVQTSITGQVNLVVDDGSGLSSIQFWNGTKTAGDGTIAGGDGVWSAGSGSNWTDSDGASSEAWGGRFAVFDGSAGVVTIDDAAGAVSATGIQFATDGYRVEGDPLTLAGAVDVRVGDGTAGGAATSATIASNLTGAGSLAKQDLGTLILTGANDYTGGTRILAGTLQIGAGGTSGTLPGNVLIGGGTLAFDRSDDVGYGGTITGQGQLRQQGAGTLTLTADSSAFTGTTTVDAGQLRVNGALGGTAIAAAGGLLGGTGRLGDIVVRSGGTLAPGNSIGLLTARSATFEAGSVFAVEVNPDGTTDLLRTTGQVVIDGGTVEVLAGAGNYAITSDYTLIEAAGGVVRGGASNGFEGVTTNLAFLTPTLGYSANAVTLNLTRNDVDFTDVAATANQRSVASAIQSAGLGSALYDAVLYLDGAGARSAFDLASGEIHASVRSAMVEDLRRPRAAVMQRLGTAPDGLGMWLQGFTSRGDNRDRPNAARIERQTNGIIGGIDVGDADARGGLAIGYGSNDITGAARASSARAKSLHVMAYGGARLAGLRLSVGAGYSDVDVDSERAPAFGGLSGNHTASYGGSVLHGFADVGLPLALGGGSVEPFAGIAHVEARTKAFTETGAGPLALAADRAKDGFTLSTLGLRAETSATGPLAVRASAAWQHGFGTIAPVSNLRFAGGTAAPFRVAGAAIARDAAVLDVDLMWRLTDKMRFSLGYSGQLGANVQDHAGTVSLGFVF